MQNVLALRSTLIAIACFISFSALAQTEAEEGDIEEVIVTAQKREERLAEVPISISVLSGEMLDKASIAGVTEALNRVPGLVANKGVQGEGTQIGIRGVTAAAANSTGSSPVGYYLDNVPLGFIRSSTIPDPGSYDLARIETLRGPQGTLYGSGGMNGLVRVITHDADLDAFEAKGRATISDTEGGGFNWRGDAALNVPIVEGKFAVRVVGGYQDLSGWIDSPSGDDINDSELKTLRLRANAAPSENVTIGFSAWSSRSDANAPSVSNDDEFTFATKDQPITSDFDLYNLSIGVDFSGVTLSSWTSYVDFDNIGLLDLTSLGVPGLGLETGFRSEIWSQEFVLNSDVASEWRWSLGAFYRNAEDHQSSLFVLPGAIRANLYDSSESYAFYGEVGRRFADDRFAWTVGLRYFHDKVQHWGNPMATTVELPKEGDTFDATTPRLVLQWFANDDVNFYASYAEGFRSGFPQNIAIRQLFPDFPAVEPDTLHNYEIGTKSDLADGRVSIDAAIYYMDWEDVQLNLTVPYINNATITTPVNGDSASGIGIDFGITARPAEAFEIGATVSWNNLELDSDAVFNNAVVIPAGERMNFSSEYTLGGFANYSMPLGSNGFQGVFEVSANYSSEQMNRLFPPPVYISQGEEFFDLSASFTLLSDSKWSLMLFGDNLTDDYGRFPGVGRNVTDWYPRLRPRTFGLQFDFAY